ncbi:MAG: helix-turn-helix domain-containing protein [Saprospiraceae bacterium]
MQGTFITLSKNELQKLLDDQAINIVNQMKAMVIDSKRKQGLNVKEASELIGLKTPTIYQYASEGKIPHRRIGRRLIFNRTELIEWVESGRPNLVQVAKDIIHKNTRQGGHLKTGIN